MFLPCKQGFPLSSGPGHNVSCGIQDAVLHAVSRKLVVEVVANFGFYSHPGLRVVLGQGAVHESASCGDVQGMGFLQPHMAVDSGAFIEPSLLERSVAAHADEIGLLRLVAEQKIVGDVVVLVYVSAGLHAHEKAVHPDLRVAEYSVKLYAEMLALVFLREIEGLPVPAHTGLREFPADLLVSVAVARIPAVGKVHNPVVGKIHGLPPLVRIEAYGVRAFIVNGIGLGQIVEILCSAAEVFCGV